MLQLVKLVAFTTACCAMAVASTVSTDAQARGHAPSVPHRAVGSRGADAISPRTIVRPPTFSWLLPTAQRHPLAENDLARSLALADLTGDGTADVVTGLELGLTVGVVLSDRRGGMWGASQYPLASSSEATLYRVEVAVGHLVGGRNPDIVAAGFSRDVVEVFPGRGKGRFAEPIRVQLGTGDEPTSVAVADLDQDGHGDIITGDGLDETVSILFGDGDGAFSAPTRLPTAAYAGKVVVADATGDGFPDILSAGEGGVSLLASDGEGGLQSPVFLSAGPSLGVIALAVADVTGDSHADLITANQAGSEAGFDAPGSVSVLAGDGAGGFGAAQVLSIGEHTLGRAGSVAVGDISGDGHADIVVGRPLEATMTLLAGDGAGGFAAPVGIAGAGGAPDPVAIADFTGDDRPDIVTNVFIGSHEMMAVLPTDGAGRVGLQGNFSNGVESTAESMVADDFNGDGWPDVASIGNGMDGKAKVAVQLGDGAGGLAESRHFDLDADSATGIASGDLDADGTPDLVVVNSRPSDFAVSLLQGDGAGGFDSPRRYPVALDLQGPHTLAIADLNGDGHLDVATVNKPFACSPFDPDCFPPELGSISILAGDGSGELAAPMQLEGVAKDPNSIVVADATGDGNPDLIVPHMAFDDPGLRLLAGDGTGRFDQPVHMATDFGPVAVVAADVTGDEQLDLVSLNTTAQSISVLAGNGSGGFGTAAHFPLYLDRDVATCEPGCPWLWPWPWSLGVADIDRDGALDVVSANTNSGTITVLGNDGTGAFPAVERLHTGGSPRAIATADFNGDGEIDIVTANTAGSVSIHVNTDEP